MKIFLDGLHFDFGEEPLDDSNCANAQTIIAYGKKRPNRKYWDHRPWAIFMDRDSEAYSRFWEKANCFFNEVDQRRELADTNMVPSIPIPEANKNLQDLLDLIHLLLDDGKIR